MLATTRLRTIKLDTTTVRLSGLTLSLRSGCSWGKTLPRNVHTGAEANIDV